MKSATAGPRRARTRRSWWAVIFLMGAGVCACGAVYPEVATPMKVAPAKQELAPPPPEDLLYITFQSATIPEKTRDGRSWDRFGGNAPDPFAQLFVDDKEVIRTPVQANTLKPTWPNQLRANYHIPRGKKIRVELWDSNAINNRPICLKNLLNVHNDAATGSVDVRCDSGAKLVLQVEPARAKLGLGMFYELRTLAVFVSRVFAESPATRAGIRPGDEIVEIQGKRVEGMEKGEAQSLINANAQTGVRLLVRNGTGATEEVTLKEGPIYPLDTEQVAF